MIINQETPFQKAIDAVESLPFDEREELLEILRMRIAEYRRDEIAANSREALQAVEEKRAKFGTVEDLKKDLLEGRVRLSYCICL
jgi:predicted AAA+ superfamily ATPase